MQSRLEYLFNCYIQGNLSALEEEALMELFAESENKAQVQKLLTKVIEESEVTTKLADEKAAAILQNILERDKANVLTKKRSTKVVLFWTRIVAAASVIIFICLAVYWVLSRQNNEKITVSVAVPSKQTPKVVPGGNHAILTMPNGSKIILDSVQNGKIKSGSATISNQGGLLVYDASLQQKAGSPVVYNTLTTPRGGQYKVVLADGSEVWLNASSSLHFPTSFRGNQRNVDLTGEAYFEIAKSKEKPFHVNINGYQVEVLGTHFDINAYADEGAIKTSLLEGSVRIKDGNTSGMLKPGQQGVLVTNGNSIEIKNADMKQVIAWKNGLFQFNGADIKSIMRQIGRWYDVEIEYTGKVPARRFEGKISRDAELSDVLKILELSNVKFTLVGKKIVVQ